MKLLILLTVICRLSCQNFISNVTFTPFSAAYGHWDVAGTNMVVIRGGAGQYFQFYDFSSNSNKSVIDTVKYNDIESINTMPFNNISNYCFSLYSSKQKSVHVVSLSNSVYSNFSSTIIGKKVIGASFGENQSELFWTHQLTTSLSNLNWNRSQISYSLNYTIKYVVTLQMYNNGSVFYALKNTAIANESVLVIYSAVNPGQPVQTYQFNYSDCLTMELDLFESYLLVGCTNNVHIRLITDPYPIIFNVTLSFPSNGFTFVSQNTFLAKSNTLVAQYNISDGSVIEIKSYKIPSPNQIRRVGLNKAFLFQKGNKGILYTTMDPCLPPNIINGTLCLPPVVTPTIVPAPTPAPALVPIINDTVVPNITIQPKAELKQMLAKASFVFGNTLAVSSIKFMMKANVPLTAFMEEFWLYKYYTNIDYPEAMIIFMDQFEIMNFLKLKPSFMSFMNFTYTIGQSLKYKDVYTSSDIVYDPIYFVQSTKQFCSSSIVMNLLIFTILKTLSILFKYLSRKCKNCLIKKIKKFFLRKSAWWALAMIIFQADFLALCYYSLNQIGLPHFYSFENKTNLVASILVYYLLLGYGIIGYSIMRISSKLFSVQLLVFSKQIKKSFWLQLILMYGIKCFKCFAHSTVIIGSCNKLICLVLIDLFIVSFLCFFKKLFYNQVHFLIYLKYQVGVLTINVLLLLKATIFKDDQNQMNYFIQYLMLTLVVFTAIKFFLTLSISIGQIRNCFSRNKVSPSQKAGLQLIYSIPEKKDYLNTTQINFYQDVKEKDRISKIDNSFLSNYILSRNNKKISLDQNKKKKDKLREKIKFSLHKSEVNLMKLFGYAPKKK